MSDPTIDELIDAVTAVHILRTTIDRSEILLREYGDRLEATEREILVLIYRVDTLSRPGRGAPVVSRPPVEPRVAKSARSVSRVSRVSREFWDGQSWRGGYPHFCTLKCAYSFALAAYRDGARYEIQPEDAKR